MSRARWSQRKDGKPDMAELKKASETAWQVGTIVRMRKSVFLDEKAIYVGSPLKVVINLRSTEVTRSERVRESETPSTELKLGDHEVQY